MKKQRLLSLDPSTIRTGASLFVGEKLAEARLLDMHKTAIENRIWTMCDAIERYVDYVKPNLVVIEDIQLQGNVQVFIRLAKLQGIIQRILRKRNIPYVMLTSSKWRRALGFKSGKGVKREQLKQKAIALVTEKYHIQYSEDVCESICIAMAYYKLKEQGEI